MNEFLKNLDNLDRPLYKEIQLWVWGKTVKKKASDEGGKPSNLKVSWYGTGGKPQNLKATPKDSKSPGTGKHFLAQEEPVKSQSPPGTGKNCKNSKSPGTGKM